MHFLTQLVSLLSSHPKFPKYRIRISPLLAQVPQIFPYKITAFIAPQNLFFQVQNTLSFNKNNHQIEHKTDDLVSHDFSPSNTTMPPNLELFLVAFLHGSLIATLLLVAISAASAVLLISFSLGLISISAIDLLDYYPLVSWCFEAAKANLELALVLMVCVIMDHVVGVALALKPLVERLVFEIIVNARRCRGYIDALKLD